jgi:hypothetical protein
LRNHSDHQDPCRRSVRQTSSVVNWPRFGGEVLQLGRYQLNDTARAGYSSEKYLSVPISICSFPGRMTNLHPSNSSKQYVCYACSRSFQRRGGFVRHHCEPAVPQIMFSVQYIRPQRPRRQKKTYAEQATREKLLETLTAYMNSAPQHPRESVEILLMKIPSLEIVVQTLLRK